MIQEIHRLRYAALSFVDAVGWAQKYPDSQEYADKARQAFLELGKMMYTTEVPNSLRKLCIAFMKAASSESYDYSVIPPKLAPWPLSEIKKISHQLTKRR